jgi:hypothetical protein
LGGPYKKYSKYLWFNFFNLIYAFLFLLTIGEKSALLIKDLLINILKIMKGMKGIKLGSHKRIELFTQHPQSCALPIKLMWPLK